MILGTDPPHMSKDYYRILGVEKGASADDIKRAFRALAHQHHPDKGGNEEKFKEINEAYQVLGDAKKRASYDQFGSADGPQFGGGGNPFGGFQNGGFSFDFGDIDPSMFGDLGDMFGGMFGGGSSRKRRGGQDIQTRVDLSFKDAVFGVSRDITFHTNISCTRCSGVGAEPGTKMHACKTCSGKGVTMGVERTIFGQMQVRKACVACHGEGETPEKPCTTCKGAGVHAGQKKVQVDIPAGIEHGVTLRVTGAGEEVRRGSGKSGDLFIEVHVEKHPSFIRKGANIYSEVKIGFTQAALGCSREIDTIDGKITHQIPAGTQTGDEVKLRGHGVPSGFGRGEHVAIIKVITPKKLTKKQQELLKELNDIL